MKKSTYQVETRTTVVPIINVSLVVVLTLMILSPFLSSEDVDVDLPQAKAAEVDDTDNIEITFTLDREIFVGEDQLQMADVQHYLGVLFADSPHSIAVVKADRNLPYGEVEGLIAEVESAQADRIALATKEKEKEKGEAQ